MRGWRTAAVAAWVISVTMVSCGGGGGDGGGGATASLALTNINIVPRDLEMFEGESFDVAVGADIEGDLSSLS